MERTPINIRGKKRDPKSQALTSGLSPMPSRSSCLVDITPRHSTLWTHKNNIAEAPASKNANSSPKTDAGPRKRRRVEFPNPSKLEKLPAELLQNIFLLSMNISLPRSSPRLAEKLSSEHMYMEFSMRCLFNPQICLPQPIVVITKSPQDTLEVTNAVQRGHLFSCRFFTWTFFQRYAKRTYEELRARCPQKTSDLEYEDLSLILDAMKTSPAPFEQFSRLVPAYLRMAGPIILPKKLLHGPWTDDKVKLLAALTWIKMFKNPGNRQFYSSLEQHVCKPRKSSNHATFDSELQGLMEQEISITGEIANEGLAEAIREAQAMVVGCLLEADAKPTTKILRIAVTEAPFNRTIVSYLLSRSVRNDNQMIKAGDVNRVDYYYVDYCDPVLWAQAERGDQLGLGKMNGEWLRRQLRNADDREVAGPWTWEKY